MAELETLVCTRRQRQTEFIGVVSRESWSDRHSLEGNEQAIHFLGLGLYTIEGFGARKT